MSSKALLAVGGGIVALVSAWYLSAMLTQPVSSMKVKGPMQENLANDEAERVPLSGIEELDSNANSSATAEREEEEEEEVGPGGELNRLNAKANSSAKAQGKKEASSDLEIDGLGELHTAEGKKRASGDRNLTRKQMLVCPALADEIAKELEITLSHAACYETEQLLELFRGPDGEFANAEKDDFVAALRLATGDDKKLAEDEARDFLLTAEQFAGPSKKLNGTERRALITFAKTRDKDSSGGLDKSEVQVMLADSRSVSGGRSLLVTRQLENTGVDHKSKGNADQGPQQLEAVDVLAVLEKEDDKDYQAVGDQEIKSSCGKSYDPCRRPKNCCPPYYCDKVLSAAGKRCVDG